MAILVSEEKLKELLFDFFDDVYEIGFGHGFENQVLFRPSVVSIPLVEKLIEECKKIP